MIRVDSRARALAQCQPVFSKSGRMPVRDDPKGVKDQSEGSQTLVGRSVLNRPQRGSQPPGRTHQAAIPMGSRDLASCTRVSPLREATLRFDMTPRWGVPDTIVCATDGFPQWRTRWLGFRDIVPVSHMNIWRQAPRYPPSEETSIPFTVVETT